MSQTKLDLLLQKRHVNVTSLAKEIGVTQKTLWNWQNGVTRIPGEGLLRLADFFGVEPVEVIGYVEDKPSRRCANKLSNVAM